MKAWIKALGMASASLLCMQAANAAVVVNYPDFSSVTGLQLNGNAAQVGNLLRVTPAIDGQSGSVFSLNPVSLASNASFSTYFQFRFSNPDLGFCDSPTTCGADGLVFTLQTVSNTAGGAGGGIGYAGLPNSVGIEFDSWNNGASDDFSSNHVGIDVGGNTDSLVTQEILADDLNNGQIWNAWVDYNGASTQLEVRLGLSNVRPALPFLALTRDLSLDLGSSSAFVGFTSGTGSSHANHDVLSWVLEDRFAPIGTPVPEPGMIALFGSAVALAGLTRRRKTRA